jgi:DNA polymerase III delta subunit
MNQEETYDALLAEYAKGSLSIDRVLRMFGIDPVKVARSLRRNLKRKGSASRASRGTSRLPK